MLPLLQSAGAAIDAIRINAITAETRSGREVWVKRRRRGSGRVISLANWFFQKARNPVRIWDRLEAWQRWEVDCFKMLNGDRFAAFAEGADAVCADRIPGRSLDDHLAASGLTDAMLTAAARELRAAHGLWSAELGGGWSHGDPHLANFIYDEASGRARMIDFEVIHDTALAPEERHADDLLVFLQDMVGLVPGERWLPAALCFVRAYDRPEVAARLRERLVIPRGVAARAWWIIRTNYLAPGELRRRIGDLRAALG